LVAVPRVLWVRHATVTREVVGVFVRFRCAFR
jgi:hypothetical protein